VDVYERRFSGMVPLVSRLVRIQKTVKEEHIYCSVPLDPL